MPVCNDLESRASHVGLEMLGWLCCEDRVVVKLERAAAAQALPKAAQPSDPKIEDVPDVNQAARVWAGNPLSMKCLKHVLRGV